jgi:excinuclease UvrABC nuclease subunit
MIKQKQRQKSMEDMKKSLLTSSSSVPRFGMALKVMQQGGEVFGQIKSKVAMKTKAILSRVNTITQKPKAKKQRKPAIPGNLCFSKCRRMESKYAVAQCMPMAVTFHKLTRSSIRYDAKVSYYNSSPAPTVIASQMFSF